MGNVVFWLMSASFAIAATPGEIAGCEVAEPSRKVGEKSLLEMRLVQAWKCLPTVGYASCTVISVLVYAAVCGSMVATRGLPQPGVRPVATASSRGCQLRGIQPIFSVYNFMDENPAQCTIRRQNRTLSRFFVEGIVHIEAFMPVNDA